MELITPRFQPHKGIARSARKLDASAVNVVFVCIMIMVLCALICTILTYNLISFPERFCKNVYFMKHIKFRNQNQRLVHFYHILIFITKKCFVVRNVSTWGQFSVIPKHVETFSHVIVTSNCKNNKNITLVLSSIDIQVIRTVCY